MSTTYNTVNSQSDFCLLCGSATGWCVWYHKKKFFSHSQSEEESDQRREVMEVFSLKRSGQNIAVKLPDDYYCNNDGEW